MLQNYRNILVTNDLTPNSVFAFHHAMMMARLSNAQLHLQHALPEVDASIRGYVSTIMGPGSLDRFPATARGAGTQPHQDETGEIRQGRVGRGARGFAPSEQCHGETWTSRRLDSPGADQINADAIVMGTHGKGALEYTFLGSVAKRVVRKSRIPVLLVPLLD